MEISTLSRSGRRLLCCQEISLDSVGQTLWRKRPLTQEGRAGHGRREGRKFTASAVLGGKRRRDAKCPVPEFPKSRHSESVCLSLLATRSHLPPEPAKFIRSRAPVSTSQVFAQKINERLGTDKGDSWPLILHWWFPPPHRVCWGFLSEAWSRPCRGAFSTWRLLS